MSIRRETVEQARKAYEEARHQMWEAFEKIIASDREAFDKATVRAEKLPE